MNLPRQRTTAPPTISVRLKTRSPYPLARVGRLPVDELNDQLGYSDSQKTAQVSDGQTTLLRAALELPDPGPEPPPSQPVRAPELRRPLWRIAAGSAAIGVGALLAGFGASALAVDGTCIEPAVAPALTCRDLFDTRGQGIGLLTSGLLVAAGGAVLLALPPSRGTTAGVALRPGGAVLSLSF